MLRRMGYAAIAVLVLGGFVLAETYRGSVTKIEDGSITIKYRKDPKDKESELLDKTIKTTKDTEYKVRKGRKDTEDSDAKKFKEAWEKNKKGVRVTVETDNGNAKSITYGTGVKKKKKDE